MAACTPAAAVALPATAAQPLASIHVLPRPARIAPVPSCTAVEIAAPRTNGAADAGALDIVNERWRALGLPPLRRAGPDERATVVVTSGAPAGSRPGRYALTVDARGVRIRARDGDGAFYAFATLAQLARNSAGRLRLPCVRIEDEPSLGWRILSDDVSRGPLPTMRYFEERIRTIAAFKMNGYSPYMEHVFVDPKHPLPAPLDGITPAQLRELAAYARRFHVALIPEQQTFAHMHGTLRLERYADLAELPHGYLLSPAGPGGDAYAQDLIADELAAVPHPPFFHIGSDEPSDLGRGRSKDLVDAQGEGPVYTRHIVRLSQFVIARSGARPMIWDDALARHPEMFSVLPKGLVFVNWHYGSEKTYRPYIERIARGGFAQMVAPGADNWNELYPDLDVALPNIDRFITEGKAARVLGLFQTVWHDDGETLFEATWYPVLYAAASAWESPSIDRTRFAADFPWAFFGSDDARYADDIAQLGRARTLLRTSGPDDSSDYLFWSDPFAAPMKRVAPAVDLAALRIAAETALAHLRTNAPPLHANAAATLAFEARRYDLLGREYQIASEARATYDDAVASADGKHDDRVYRSLYVTKYAFWELRDAMLELEPLARAAWEYENRPSHEESVLERYHVAAARAIERADRVDRATRESYLRDHTLPPFDDLLKVP